MTPEYFHTNAPAPVLLAAPRMPYYALDLYQASSLRSSRSSSVACFHVSRCTDMQGQ